MKPGPFTLLAFLTPSTFSCAAEVEVSKSIRQLNLAYKDTMDGAPAKKLGETLNYDTITVGTVSDLQKGSDVDLTVKMKDAKTGVVVSATSTTFLRSKQVSLMMENF